MSNHKDPLEMTTLIGIRCKRGNMFSRDVLIDQEFLSTTGGEKVGLRVAIICCFKIFTKLDLVFWWFNGGGTPLLIPNTEVKLASGDGTALYRAGE